ncbi:MAG: DUF349 domain-containing protein [Colwellia sp.]|nr:DUF349 domain-containing protein [Colwellia sp.]
MIFSKFFKAKWQHKDSNVRLTTVSDDLSITSHDDLIILKQLLANDENELVRRAVLLKINTFEQWLSASSENSNTKIRDYAHQQIVKMINGQHSIDLTNQQKQLFLSDGKYKALLEPWLHNEVDAEIIISLIEKINKPHLAVGLFNQKQIEKVQLYLIAQTQDVVLLDKFSKKAVNGEVTDTINNKLVEIKVKVEKPIKLSKKIQLLLSKLLALKDTTDYQTYLLKKSQLEEEWQVVQNDFSCLDNEIAANFLTKYEDINQQLKKAFIAKEELYQQQIIEQQLTTDKLAATNEFKQQLTELEQTLTTSVFENALLDEAIFSTKLDSLSAKVKGSVLNDAEKSGFDKLITQLAKRLTQLPDIAKSVTDATGLISKISQLAIPSTIAEYIQRQPTFDEWQTSWKAIEKQTKGFLPESIKNAHKEIQSAWLTGLKPFAQQQQSLFVQTQKKMADLKRLLSSGKYNACFGLFKGIEKNFAQLSLSQQHRLERDFEKVSKQIADLSDWEHYIATPRKQQLLDEINEIVTCPLDNPNEQSSKVKQFRKAWNLLGHADEDIDKSLNEAFNLACEQAFAPCRLFFSEQEKLRTHHLETRLALIEQAKKIAISIDQQTECDHKELEGQLNKLNKSWLEAGEVDRNKYKPLQQEFVSVIQPLKIMLRTFHDSNITLKNMLIEKVNVELLNDDIHLAIENTKKLQNQWRDIGYAGPKQDNRLWQAFRAANDQLFQKRDALKIDEKEQQTKQKLAFEQQFTAIQSEFSDQCDKGQLSHIKQQANDLHQQVKDSRPVIKSVLLSIERFIVVLDNQDKAIDVTKEKKNWSSLFSVLSQVANSDFNEQSINESADYLSLTQAWQKKLVDAVFSRNTEESLKHRQMKTLELEILAGIDSPKEYAQQRMAIQVQLMQDKMTSGNEVNLTYMLDYESASL